jgi:hypothetical protein
MTYRKWLEAGFRVKSGERSVHVKQFRLFCRKQVEPLMAPTSAKLPVLSPVATAKASKAKAANGVADKIETAKAKAIAAAKATAPNANVTPIRPAKGNSKDQPTLPL